MRALAWYECPSAARSTAEVVTPLPAWGSAEGQNENFTVESRSDAATRVLTAYDDGLSLKAPVPEEALSSGLLLLDQVPPVGAEPQPPVVARSN